MDQQTGTPPTDGENAEPQRPEAALKLEALLAWRLKDAITARESSGIEEIWLADEDLYNGYDELNRPGMSKETKDGTAEKPADGRSRIYLNITKPKTDTAVSRVQEMLVPHDDKPWEIGPTPVPELQQAIDRNDDRPITLADGKTAPAADVARATMAKAQESAKRMGNQFEDWFVEGKVYPELRKVIRDGGRLGTGILKGPFPVARRDRKWSIKDGTATLAVAERIAPTSRAISAWDLYPDPSCGDNIHQGGYLFERDYLTGKSLRQMAGIPGIDRMALAEVLLAGPMKRARFDRHNREKDGETRAFDTSTYEVYYYYGDVPPEDLIASGYDVGGLIDAKDETERAGQMALAMQLVTVNVMVMMVNDRIVKVTMNPLETGEFPFDVFVWEPVDGQPWGRGVPRKIEPAQKMLVAGARALMENAGLSTGPQIIARKGEIEPWNGRYEIRGRKGWWWNPPKGDETNVDDVRKAFTAILVPSAQAELSAIIEFALRMADELSNMPLLLQGIVGSAPDTVGGMAMLQSNAASPLKTIAKQFDDGVIVPHLTRYYAWGMQDPNVPAEAKGDMQCKARGSTALIQREQAGQFLVNIAELIKDPKFRASPEKWFAEMCRAQKFDPAAIQYDDEEWKRVQEQMEQAGQQQDPRIMAAQLNAQVQQGKIAAQREENQLDRAHEARIKAVEFQIQAMEFAGQKEITFEQLRAMLAATAIKERGQNERFAAERQFAVTEGEGRGL